MFGSALKSLFKSSAQELKEKFSNDEEEEFATPLGLRIGAAVDIDTLPLRMHADDLHIPLPDETIIIVAQGYVELGDDSYVHRYYAANDIMVQVLTINGMEDEHIEEVTLFAPFKSHYPNSEGEWAKWSAKGGKIGASTYALADGTEFERIWFDETEGFAEPVAFWESVYEDPESDDHSEIYHQAMLYGRNLDAGKKNEYLLISAESYDDEKTIEEMIGVDLELATLKVI
jgi:hypothetical protein